MVDLTRVPVGKGLPETPHNPKTKGHQAGSETVQSQKFDKLFKQNFNKVTTPESGIRESEYGDILPNSSAPLITLESKSLRGGMLLLVGGDEPTNDVIEEFAHSQGVDAELIAQLMKDPSSASERNPSALNLAQQVSSLSNKEPVSQEKISRGLDLLTGTVKEETKQNTPLPATPGKFIATEAISAKGLLIQPKYVTQLDLMSKQTSNNSEEGNSLMGQEKTPRGLDLLTDSVKDKTKQNTSLPATPEKFVATEAISAKGLLIQPKYVTQLDLMSKQTSNNSEEGNSLMGQEKTPRGLDLLTDSVKDKTKQNTSLPATPEKFVATESISAKGPLLQPSQALQNQSLPLNPHNLLLDGEHDDGILVHTKNVDSLATLTDVTGKRTSVERPVEILMIQQEQHSDMSKKLAEALGQRLAAQVAKGVWQIELDIHPKSLGRIEIHLEMRGGELEAHFNPAKALTKELLQDGMPRLKEELREHGIETAYLGFGSGKQGTYDGKSTPYDNEDVAERQAKATELEPKSEGLTERNQSDGLDIII